jgi:hypothetical protein
MERHQHRVLLLATDDRDREGLTYLLALRGIAVVPARSSEAALDALRADAGFCLIVVDAPPAGAAALPILATDWTRRLPAVVARAPGSEAAEDGHGARVPPAREARRPRRGPGAARAGLSGEPRPLARLLRVRGPRSAARLAPAVAGRAAVGGRRRPSGGGRER